MSDLHKGGDLPLRLFSGNCYLIPYLVAKYLSLKNASLDLGSCVDQHQRVQRLTEEIIKSHDVAVLQEMWGAEAHIAQDALLEGGFSILERNMAWRGIMGSGYLADVVNLRLFNGRKNGGLMLASRDACAEVLWEKHHTFEHNEGEEYMNKSVNVTLLKVDEHVWKNPNGSYLLIANTHLYSPLPFHNDIHRRKQREEIRRELVSIQNDPTLLPKYPDGFRWSQCGVLLMGDFNTAFHQRHSLLENPEYIETLHSFGPDPVVDIYKTLHPDCAKHSYCKKNRYVSAPDDSSRMDYCFSFHSLPGSVVDPTVKVPVMPLKVRNCELLSDPRDGQHMSDHYPLSFSVTPL